MADLDPFKTEVRHSARELHRLFKVQVRGGLDKDPMSQLKALLALVGLKTVKVKGTNVGGKKTYFYRVDAERLQLMRTIAASVRV